MPMTRKTFSYWTRASSQPEMPNFRRQVSCRVRPDESGQSVLSFLTSRFAYRTGQEWQRLLAEKRLLLNQQTALPGMMVQTGDEVEFVISGIAEPPVNGSYSILFEDDWLLAVNKPGNLPIHPAGRFFNHTLWALLKRDRPDMPVHFVNRLDRETSGVVLVAKSSDFSGRCAAALAHPEAVKVYTAIVEGKFPDKSIRAEGVLIPHPDSKVRKKLAFAPRPGTLCTELASRLPGGMASDIGGHSEGKETSTVITKTSGDDNLSILEIKLQSGRTHQIRATLESLGFPVVGDKLYGVDETIFLRFINDSLTDTDRRRLRLDRQALHAGKLIFMHPGTGELLHVQAPIPEDMKIGAD